jgi:hypothetical protein
MLRTNDTNDDKTAPETVQGINTNGFLLWYVEQLVTQGPFLPE